MKCKRCFSYAINPHMNGRDKTDLDLCDVCYWRKRAELVPAMLGVVESAEETCRVYGEDVLPLADLRMAIAKLREIQP